MAEETIGTLKKRIEKAESEQLLYQNLFETAYELALPQRNLWSLRSQGEAKTEKVFDSTGMIAVNSFVNRMQSALTPPFQKWAELTSGPAIPEERRQEVNKVLEVMTSIAFSVLNSSNFSVAVGEMYYDLAVGTGAMLILEGDDETPIRFFSVPTSEIALDEGESGKIEGIFRKHEITGRGVEGTWTDRKFKVVIPIELKKLIKDKPSEKIKFDEVTYWDNKDKIWRYEVLWKREHRIVQAEYKVNPWVIVRWSKIAGEVFGRGPLLQALPDLKMLNKVKELGIKSAQLNVFGAWTVADDNITNVNNIRIRPNALIPVSRNAGPNGPSIQRLPTTGDFNQQNFMVEELRQQINTLMLAKRLPPDAGPVRSATEIVQRVKELQVDAGASFGRLMFEFIQPLFQRVIQILENKGIIAFGGGIKIDNITTTVQILSPLAKSQGIDEVQSIVQADQTLKALDPSGQTSIMTMNLEKTGAFVANKLGVPASLLRTDEEKRELMAGVIESQKQNQQQEGVA